MKKIIIIDTYGFIYRAYHVQPKLTSQEGAHVGAIYGFTSMLIKLLNEQNPTHVVAIFDTGKPTFRHKIYPEYKSNRPPAPADLISQFPITREVAEAFNIKTIEVHGFEADDVISTIATIAKKLEEDVIIVSADKDLAQLMDDYIKIFDPIKSKLINEEDIKTKFGVAPNQIRDVLALMGDASDNIPGVPGFGPKTAADLINKFGSFDAVLNNSHLITSERQKRILEENIEKAKLSYELVTLIDSVPIDIEIDSLKWQKPAHSNLTQFMQKYGFRSLIERAKKISAYAPNVDLQNLSSETTATSGNYDNVDANIAIENIEEIEELTKKYGFCSILPHNNEIYISYGPENNQLVSKITDKNSLSSILRDDSILKIVYDIREIFLIYDEINSYDDINIMHYLLSSGLQKSDLQNLFIKYTDIEANDPFAIATHLQKLSKFLKQELYEANLLDLYISIELPIAKILNKIEKTGVLIDTQKLLSISKEFGDTLEILSEKIYAISKRPFNILSPKQLGEILFTELKLPVEGITYKTKNPSTSAEVLDSLASKGYEIADLLLKYRQFAKLKNTYADALPKMVNNTTGRIHTTLNQTTTATGRLSSQDPNLQNIPVRTKEGEKIRSAIIASKGYKLICADYSQIELRIVAEIANINELKKAFAENIDIHKKTASQIFDVRVEDVTSEMRRKAKAINFGIIYGISSFGLAKQLSISKYEAMKYIDKYFATYPGITNYMARERSFARNHGYVLNKLGRKCYVPLINSNKPSERGFAERAAINAPIQGYAADIIKIAMIQIDKIFSMQNIKAKMILQVHDELIFEAEDEEVGLLVPLIRKTMENAVIFDPGLKVDIKVSNMWG
ncbi:MAG: DNA polymerase I [Rickettsiaceae bacterium]|nr:DNA polymerase I [Rickettsiaceae bacterium]